VKVRFKIIRVQGSIIQIRNMYFIVPKLQKLSKKLYRLRKFRKFYQVLVNINIKIRFILLIQSII